MAAFVHFHNWLVENVDRGCMKKMKKEGVEGRTIYLCSLNYLKGVSGGRPRQRHLFHTRMIQGNDTPMTPGVQSPVAKGARFYPTELLHEIVTLTLSRYLSDVLIAPASTRSWDAIGALLHVDYHFRSCTQSVLNALWGGDFVDRKTGCVFFTHYPGIQTQSKGNK